MLAEITDPDKMNICLNKLLEFNEHAQLQQIKEQIKMHGALAEIF
jgi:hypothetical protein